MTAKLISPLRSSATQLTSPSHFSTLKEEFVSRAALFAHRDNHQDRSFRLSLFVPRCMSSRGPKWLSLHLRWRKGQSCGIICWDDKQTPRSTRGMRPPSRTYRIGAIAPSVFLVRERVSACSRTRIDACDVRDPPRRNYADASDTVRSVGRSVVRSPATSAVRSLARQTRG